MIIYEHCKPLTMYMMDVKRAARFRGRGGRSMATPVRRVPGRVGLVLTRKVANKRSSAAIVAKARTAKLLARLDAKGKVIE